MLDKNEYCNNRVFKPVSNTENGETTNQTTFFYKQEGNIITAEYSGGKILKGHLIGLHDENGNMVCDTIK